MDEEHRKAYQDRFKARIAEWEAKLEGLSARARRAEADLRIKLQAEESELRKKLDDARARLKELQAASEDGWEDIRTGAEKMWGDLREAWDRTSRKAQGEDDPPTPGSNPGG